MNSRKRPFPYDLVDENDSDEIPSKQLKKDLLSQRTDKVFKHLRQVLHNVEHTECFNDFIDLTLPGRTMPLLSPGYTPAKDNGMLSNHAEKDPFDSKDKGSAKLLNFSPPLLGLKYTLEKSQKNTMRRSAFSIGKNRFGEPRFQRPSSLFSDVPVKSTINSFGDELKRRVTPASFSHSYNPVFGNLGTSPASQSAQPFAHALGKSGMRKNAEHVSKENYTATSCIKLQEREQYKSLLEQFTQKKLFYSNTLPAKRNLLEWNSLLDGTKQDSNKKENVVLENGEKPPILEAKPGKYAELREGLLKHRNFSSQWLQELKSTLYRGNEEIRKYVEERERRIALQCEKQAANHAAKRALYMKQVHVDKFTISSNALEIVNLNEKLVLPELTPEMNMIIDKALSSRDPSAVVCKNRLYQLLKKDFETLASYNWVNDEIINSYMRLIVERSMSPTLPSVYAFNSFFYSRLKTGEYASVRRWTMKTDIFEYDIILVPMHLGVHWCLCVIDNRFKKVKYYDSMDGREQCLSLLKAYLISESIDKKMEKINLADWSFEQVKKIPPQLNGSDCGVFTLKYAEYVTRNAAINFTQEHMPYFRKKMVYELMTMSL